MVSVEDSRLSGPGSSVVWSTVLCTVFLGKTLYSHSASLHPGVPRRKNEIQPFVIRKPIDIYAQYFVYKPFKG